MFWRPDAEYDECEFDEDEEVRLLTKLLIPEKSIEAPIIAIHAMVEAAVPAEMFLFCQMIIFSQLFLFSFHISNM